MSEGPPSLEAKEKIQFPEIAREIDAMTEADQSMRKRALSEKDFWDEKIDIQNTKRMKEVIAQIGWPTISKVGKESSRNAWLIVQHADLDTNFQQTCLALMIQAGEDVKKSNIAYLEDRIRVNTKRPQLYGTQFQEKRGEFLWTHIEDEEHLDERRKLMGLGDLDEGIRDTYDKYEGS